MQALTKTGFADRLKRNVFFRLYKTYIIESILIVKNHGFKEVINRKGIKFLVVIFLYYLIRDSIIYIIIPVLIAKGFIK